jgi:undecaprenyl pyrophosphate phosphatase UppP
VNVKKVNVNVDQEIIMITEDRAKLCLMKYLENIGKRDSWTTPLAILLAVIVTLATTSFKQFLVSADVWQAIFLIVGGLSVLWLANSLRKRPKAKKIEDVIKELKAATRNNEEVEDVKENPKEAKEYSSLTL